jgi:hypothetical protein
MWRAFFLAIGITAAIIGAECLVCDRAILVQRASAAGGPPPMREIVLPDWAAWTMVSTGAVVMLYSFTVPRKLQA